MAKRITVKEIKRPDEFISSSAQILKFLIKNKKTLIPLLIGILILIIGSIFYSNMLQKREEKAQIKLYRALYEFRKNQASSFRSSQSESSAPDDMEIENKYKEIRKEFEEIIDEFPKTHAAWQAQLYLANCQYELKEYLQAIDTYEKFLEKRKKILKRNVNIEAMVLYNLGHLYEILGYIDRALEYYRSVMDLGSTLYTQMIGEDIRRCQFKSEFLKKNVNQPTKQEEKSPKTPTNSSNP